MLLAYNANSATIAANLGKWRPNAANPTGLYVPNLSEQFFRAWTLGAGREAGAWYSDETRPITGSFAFQTGMNGNAYVVPVKEATNGAFSTYGNLEGRTVQVSDVEQYGPHRVDMDTSHIIPTGPENVPQHIWQPLVIYLGLSA